MRLRWCWATCTPSSARTVVAVRRLHEFMDDYGLDDLILLSNTILDKSEAALVQGHRRSLPDGVSERTKSQTAISNPSPSKSASRSRATVMLRTLRVARRSSGTRPSTPFQHHLFHRRLPHQVYARAACPQ